MSATVETVLVVGLMLAALAMTGAVLFVSFRSTTTPEAAGEPPGVLVRIPCPATGAPARVRIGKDRSLGTLAVLWCERFPTGAIDCDRACFTVIGESSVWPGTAVPA